MVLGEQFRKGGELLMATRKITAEEKISDIEQACELYKQAGELIAKADKLVSKNVRDVQVSGRFPEIRPLKGVDVVSKEYYGLVPVSLYSGITRLEKATGVKSYAKLDYQEKKCTGERALVVGGIVFTQLGTATLEKHTYR